MLYNYGLKLTEIGKTHSQDKHNKFKLNFRVRNPLNQNLRKTTKSK